MENRQTYKSNKGVVAWWPKDGAWHVAEAEEGREGFFWTTAQYRTREEAIEALNDRARPVGGQPNYRQEI